MDRCHPTWWPNFHNHNVHHLSSPSLKNWRQDSYAYHFTSMPRELQNETALMASNSIFAQMGRYILEKAGRLPKKNANKHNPQRKSWYSTVYHWKLSRNLFTSSIYCPISLMWQSIYWILHRPSHRHLDMSSILAGSGQFLKSKGCLMGRWRRGDDILCCIAVF